MEVLQDALCMCLNNVLGYSFHAEDLDVEACAIREGIIDCTQILLMNLAHVHAEAACGVEPPAASLTFEVLCLLMIYEDLEIVEVALAVVAPRSRKDFFDVGVVALLLRHDGRGDEAELRQ